MPKKTKKSGKDDRKKVNIEDAEVGVSRYSMDKALKLFLLLGKELGWNLTFSDDSDASLAYAPKAPVNGVRQIRGVTKEEQDPLGFVYLSEALCKEANAALSLLSRAWEATEVAKIKEYQRLADTALAAREETKKMVDRLQALIDKMTEDFAEALKESNELHTEVYDRGYEQGKVDGEEEFNQDSFEAGRKEGAEDIGESYLPLRQEELLRRHLRDYCGYTCPINRKAPHVIPAYCGNCPIAGALVIMEEFGSGVYWSAYKEEHFEG